MRARGKIKYASEMPIFEIAFAQKNHKNKKRPLRPLMIKDEMRQQNLVHASDRVVPADEV